MVSVMALPAQQKKAREKLFLQALHGTVTPAVPFWLMRQAGRYLPEYRALREKAGSFLDLCFNPDFAVEVTLQPLRRFDMDAAILFSDILVVPYALGQALSFIEGEGPQLGPLDLNLVQHIDKEAFDKKLSPVYETLRRLRQELPPEKALIGFAGAPWTIACYMVQGRGGNEFKATRAFAAQNAKDFDALITVLTDMTAHYLCRQIENGAEAVQLFDSWAGLAPEKDFDRFVLQPAREINRRIQQAYPGFPVIGFPRGAGPRYARYIDQAGFSAVGLDQNCSLTDIARCTQGRVALQGNLDPEILLRGGAALEGGVKKILQEASDIPFVFNLGHGVIKETPPEHVARLSQIVKEHRR